MADPNQLNPAKVDPPTKRGRGRPRGANGVKTQIRRAHVTEILERIDEPATWAWVFEEAKKAKDVRTVLDALKYLTDRRDGRAAQALNLSGQGFGLKVYVGGKPARLITSNGKEKSRAVTPAPKVPPSGNGSESSGSD